MSSCFSMASGIRTVIDKLLYTKTGQIITSCIFGIAFALLFQRVCKENCTKYFAPYIEEVHGKVFKLEDTCYKYSPYIVKCEGAKNVLDPYEANAKPVNKLVYKSNISEN